MEWPIGGDEWATDIADPTERMTVFAQMVGSMLGRFEKAGSIGVLGYWAEPPRALRSVELLQSYINRCLQRKAERNGA